MDKLGSRAAQETRLQIVKSLDVLCRWRAEQRRTMELAHRCNAALEDSAALLASLSSTKP